MAINPKTDTQGSEFRPKPRPRKRKLFSFRNLLIFLIVCGVVAGFVYLGNKYKEAQRDVERLSNPEEAVKQEALNLTNRVSQLVEVPAGQEPTIATVQDVTKLQGQAFFKNAQNGDKVLIYAEAKKAILYRPSTDKIIEVAPINIGENQTTVQEAPQTPALEQAQ